MRSSSASILIKFQGEIQLPLLSVARQPLRTSYENKVLISARVVLIVKQSNNMDYWIWSLLVVALTYTITSVYRQLSYFSRWRIPHPLELPLVGAIYALFFPRRHINDFIRYIYDSDPDAKYVGAHVFTKPVIFIRDLDLVKSVLVKHFDHFADRKTFVDEKADPLFGRNLNFLNGDRWKEIRTILSPAFTSSKMKTMYVLMSKCAENFTDEFLSKYENVEAVNMKDVIGRYTNDTIASCAFGIEVDSMKEPNNEFYLQAKETTKFQVRVYSQTKHFL